MPPTSLHKALNRHAALVRIALYSFIAILTAWATFTSYSAKLNSHGTEAPPSNVARSAKTSASKSLNLNQDYGKIPLSFEINSGQTDASVKYFARGAGYNIFFTNEETVLVLPGAPQSTALDDDEEASDLEPQTNQQLLMKAQRQAAARAAVPPTVLRMRLERGNAVPPTVTGSDELPGKVNYFFGNDSSKWRTNVPTYGKVTYNKVYPGIDLVYYGNRQQLEYDLVVAPGANPDVIQFAIDGADGVRLDKAGNLVLKTKSGDLQQLKPTIYQEVDGVRKEVKGRYELRAGNKVGFRVSRYDRGRKLVIDPILRFVSIVNGGGQGIAITTDPAGNAYFTGFVTDTNLNPTAGVFQISSGGGFDCFVTKLNANGSSVFYTTYLGGSRDDFGYGISIDNAGNAFIGGTTQGTFPTTPGALQSSLQGTGDGFITKLNPTGSALIFSTYFGGNGIEEVDSFGIAPNGDVHFSGLSNSSNLPVTAGAFSTFYQGGYDGYAGKLTANGSSLIYLTYIPGGGFDYPIDMTLDSAGNVYLAGQTTSTNFPTINPIQSAMGGGVTRGVFKSTNGGSNWSLGNSGYNGGFIYSIAIHPTSPSTIYLGTDGGVYKSVNGGGLWSALNNPTARVVRQLIIDPSSPNTIYAATDVGVFKSTSGGTTWTFSSNGIAVPLDVRGIALSPTSPNTIYVAGLTGVYKSTDGAANWTAINTGLPAFCNANTSGIVVDPTSPNTAYVVIANASRVFKTTNGGASWAASSTGLPNSLVNTIAINPTTPTTLYVGTNTVGIYRSTNGGANWSAVTSGLAAPRSDTGTFQNPPILNLALDPTNPNNVYAAAGASAPSNGSFYTLATIFKSIDAGTNWTAQGTGFNNPLTIFSGIAVDPITPNTIYAGSLGDADAFVLKLNPTGTAGIFSTYLGGDRTDAASVVVLDAASNIYVSGSGRSGFPATPGAFQTVPKGITDSFVAKINAAGNTLLYSTLLGGTDAENAVGGLSVDSQGNAYVTSATASADFPVTPGAFQTTIGNPGVLTLDLFITKLNPAGNALVYSSFLGGGGNDLNNPFFGRRLSLDANNNAYLLGTHGSTNFPASDFINTGATTSQTFVAKIDGTVATYSISGRITTGGGAAVPGVSVQASTALDQTYYGTTDAQGYYTIINVAPGDYTVTPQRYGTNGHYIYAPSNISVSIVNSSPTANFTATQAYDIFGNVTSSTVPGLGVFDVTISLTGAATASTTSDANGNFMFQDLLAGNYVVTPSKPGFTFNPTNIPFNNLAGDQFANFTTASTTFFTISGRAATPANASINNADVSLTLLPQRGQLAYATTTDVNGNYSFPNLQSGGNYTVTIAKPLLSFTPQSPTITNLSSNQTINFTSAPVTGLIGKLAFVSLAGLGVMNADTTGETTLTPLAFQCSSDESSPVWSPDGSKIAFTNCDATGTNLFHIKSDGTGLTQVTADPAFDLFPSFAPDGDQITYTFGECSGTDHLVPEVFATNLSGTIRTNLTNTPIVDAYSDWSPNGSRIVFTRAQSTDCSGAGSDDADLFTIRSTGGGDVQLTNTPDAEINPRYSPDGSKIAFVRSFEDPTNNIFKQNIFVMNSDGTNVVKLTPDTMFASGPTWSPDGTKIAFYGQFLGPPGSSQLFVMNADGTGLAQLTSGPTFRETPAWQHYSISGHLTGNTDGPVTMVLAGTLSRVTQTNANGDYVFGNLTPGGNYSVTPISTAFTFSPGKIDVNNLTGNQTADFTVLPPIPTPTPPLSDDFQGTQRDTTRWNLGTLTQPMLAFDPLVTVQQVNGQLRITPRTNVDGLHYNGYVSVNSFDFTNATATVQVLQVATGGADTIFAIGTDLDNFTRFVVRQGSSAPDMYNPTQSKPLGTGVAQLIFQVRISGQLTSLSIPYNPVLHAYFRFRHDPVDNSIVFETSPNNKDFTEQHRVVLQRGVSALTAELSAGTSTPTNPGTAIFDNFQLVTNTFQFGSVVPAPADANAGEGAGRVDLTITRIGSSSGVATVDYITRDTAGLTNCNVFNGIASSRCDYATSIGTVRFGAGETVKTISVPLVDDGFAEGPETFTVSVRNAAGAGIGTPSRSIVTIDDNDPVTQPNPLDTTPFFVRQQYVDFLNREPDPAGFAAWQSVINNCPAGDTTCDRIHVSSAFFRSPEFQGRGYFVYRFYPVSFGRKPDYTEFMPDLAKVSGFLSDQQLEDAKIAFIAEFINRPAFKSRFDSLDNTQYVDTLLATAGITHIARDFWIAALGNGTRTRAQVLREISESTEVYNKYYNQAFVVMQYFGYLRRDPDALYLNWLQVLDTTGDFRGMVNGFSNSLEYRFRFGP